MVAGEPVPEVDVSRYEHVRHAFGERIEKYVESRRGRELEEVLDELEERLAERLGVYRSRGGLGRARGAGPFGPTTDGAAARRPRLRHLDPRAGRPRGRRTARRASTAVQPRTACPSSSPPSPASSRRMPESNPATPWSSTSPGPRSAGPGPGSRSTTARPSAVPLFTGESRGAPRCRHHLADDVDARSPGGWRAVAARPRTCTSSSTATTTSLGGCSRTSRSSRPWASPLDAATLLHRQPLRRHRHRGRRCRLGRAHRPRPHRPAHPVPALGARGGRALGLAADEVPVLGTQLLVHLPRADGLRRAAPHRLHPRPRPRGGRERRGRRLVRPGAPSGGHAPRDVDGRSPSTCPSPACSGPRSSRR